MKLTFAKRALILLLATGAFLVGMHLLVHYFELTADLSPFAQKLVPRFSMDVEVSIPTWFEQALFLVLAAIFALIGYAKRKKKAAFQNHWILLAAIFVYLSLDEASEIHELAIDPVQALFGIESGPLFFAWIIPAVVILGVLAVLYMKFYLHLPRRTKVWIAAACLTFIAGAVGVEMISGAYWESVGFSNNMTYRTLNALEEGLEITGLALGIYAMLEFVAKEKVVKISV